MLNKIHILGQDNRIPSKIVILIVSLHHFLEEYQHLLGLEKNSTKKKS